MIDVGFWEVAMIGVMALIILGPERLPKVARTAGLWIGKARSMVREMKADIQSEIDSAEIAELGNIKDEIREAGETFKSKVTEAESNFKSEASEMDTAIADALNQPTTDKTLLTDQATTNGKPDSASNAVSEQKAKPRKVGKPSNKKNTANKISKNEAKSKSKKKKKKKKKITDSNGKAKNKKSKVVEDISEKSPKSIKK